MIPASTLQQAHLSPKGKADILQGCTAEMRSCSPWLWEAGGRSVLSASLFVATHWSELQTRSWYRGRWLVKFHQKKKSETFWNLLIVLVVCFFSLKLKTVHKPKFAQFWTANLIWSLTFQISILNLGGWVLFASSGNNVDQRSFLSVKPSTFSGTDIALMN